MLRALDYAVSEPAARGSPETVNRCSPADGCLTICARVRTGGAPHAGRTAPALRSAFPRGRNSRLRPAPRLPRCASSNSRTPSSQPNAASAEMPRLTPPRSDQCRSMCAAAAGAGPATHLAIDATEASVIFKLNAERLKEPGTETYCIDLTGQHFAVSVVRVIAPGLQLEPRRWSRHCGIPLCEPVAAQPIPTQPIPTVSL